MSCPSMNSRQSLHPPVHPSVRPATRQGEPSVSVLRSAGDRVYRPPSQAGDARAPHSCVHDVLLPYEGLVRRALSSIRTIRTVRTIRTIRTICTICTIRTNRTVRTIRTICTIRTIGTIGTIRTSCTI